jgi:hypothetical protein
VVTDVDKVIKIYVVIIATITISTLPSKKEVTNFTWQTSAHCTGIKV